MAEIFKILEFPELDSTNAYALREFGGLADRSTITALRQTSGRGRLNRVWLSEGKGLYFTIIVKPACPDKFPFANLTQLLAVSVRAALAEIGLEPLIKWPNDILCGDAKICGILAEAVTESGRVAGAVLGAGINLCQTAAEFGELPYPAVSIAMLGRPVPPREQLLTRILRLFYGRYPGFERQGFAAVSGEYTRYFSLLGSRGALVLDGRESEGKVEGVDKNGRLILNTASGARSFSAGDLSPV